MRITQKRLGIYFAYHKQKAKLYKQNHDAITGIMQYVEANGNYAIELTAEETDRFFEPFDYGDTHMPSHLFHGGHRYIKEDIFNWLQANVGDVDRLAWKSCPLRSNTTRFFQFETKEAAMLFKLVHFGV